MPCSVICDICISAVLDYPSTTREVPVDPVWLCLCIHYCIGDVAILIDIHARWVIMLICRLDGSHRCVIACVVCLYVSIVCIYVRMKHLLSQLDSQMCSALYLNIAVCREWVQWVLNAWLCMEYTSHVWCDYSLAACVFDDDSLLSVSASFTTTEAFRGKMSMQCRSVCRCVVVCVHSNATCVCTVTPSQYSYITKGVCFVKAPQCHKEHQTEMAFNT